MRILRAIVAGERDLDILASYRDPSCKNSSAVIRRSLEGNYREEHLFQLQQSLALYDYHTTVIEECEQEIAKKYQPLPAKADPELQPLPAPELRILQNLRPSMNHRDTKAAKISACDLQAFLAPLCDKSATSCFFRQSFGALIPLLSKAFEGGVDATSQGHREATFERSGRGGRLRENVSRKTFRNVSS